MHYAEKLRLGQMELWAELVGPERAKFYLEKNINNRKMKPSAVIRYTSDMLSGNWEVKPVAICFDEEGCLGNGQHTLQAIVKSGKSQLLLIASNASRSSIAMMDVGMKRTLSDIGHFIGEDFGQTHAAVARILMHGRAERSRGADSFSELLEAYQFYKKAIDFAFSAGGKGKVTSVNAITQSVAAMAWYTRDRSRIAEFMQCLRTGNVNGRDDNAAIRLRELFIKGSTTGASIRVEQFRKTVSALDHFLNRNSATKLYGRDADIFPYPKMEA